MEHLTTEQFDLIEMSRELAADIATRADEADRESRLPAEDVDLLKRSGYLGLSVPVEFGGFGCSLAQCVAAHLELSQGSASTGLVAAMQLQIFGHQRETRSWRDDAYERLCREAASGSLFNSIASEPKMGSPSRGGLPESRAVRSDDGAQLIVNGHKTWSSGGAHLTHMLVRVALEDEPAVVLITQGLPGIEWVGTWQDALSLRASDSNDVYFRDVVVPAENLIELGKSQGGPNVWFPMILSATYLGSAIAARNTAIKFALERVPTALGKPIATLPKIQRQIGEIDMALQAAQSLLMDVAEQWTGKAEDREAIMPRVAAAKMMVNESANMATEKALQVAGGASITHALPLERYFRDVRAGSMQPPSGDTALEIIGRAAIGM